MKQGIYVDSIFFVFLLSLFSHIVCADTTVRAPRNQEQAGISVPVFNQSAGSNINGEVERDEHVPRDLFVGRNLTVAGTITGMIVAIPPLILKPLVGNQACIIFQQADAFEKARICSSTVLNDKGVFISVDGGVTENFRVTNAGDTSLANNLLLVDSTLTVGNVYKSGTLFLHNFGTDNTFLGENAGNLTLSSTGNVGIGTSALVASTTGNNNVAVGNTALASNTIGFSNVAIGWQALNDNISGDGNVAVGAQALQNAANPDANTAIGATAMGLGVVTGGENVALGASSFRSATSGFRNTALGNGALFSATSASSNVSIGYTSLFNLASGTNNVCIGLNAGNGLTLADSNNIFIGAGQTGIAGENNTIRIGGGGASTRCFIEGINGVNVGASANIVGVVAGNQLGTTATTFTLTGNESLTGNLLMVNSTSTTGNIIKGGTLFMHNFGTASVFLGASAGNLTNTGTGNTAMGESALTALTSGTNNVALGRSALISNTSGGGNVAVGFETLSSNLIGTNNVAVGVQALRLATGDFNIAVGQLAMGAAVVTGSENVAIGASALRNVTSGVRNMAIGNGALFNATSASNNVAIGYLALQNLGTGGSNVAIGLNAGNALTLADSSNIFIGAGQSGVAGESNTTRIGAGGTTTRCFIEGINGVSAGASANIVGVNASNQLGTTATTLTLTGNESLTGNLLMVNSTSTTGNIIKGGSLFMHNFGTSSTFLGSSAGNLTNTGTGNTAVGAGSLTAVTTGGGNVALGLQALASNLTGSNNLAIGSQSLQFTTAADANIAIGQLAMGSALVSGNENVAVGPSALRNCTSGQRNLAVGNSALFNMNTGSLNVALGYLSLQNITSGGSNVCIGANAGSSLTVSDSNNIFIGTNQLGLAGDNNTIRIGGGGASTRCFIEGISGVTTALAAVPVLVDAAGQLGTISSSRRYKTNIYPLEDSADKFMQLNPVEFTYISDETDMPQWGLIAEEVEELYPELVVYNSNGNPETLRYHLLYALLIKMIQDNRRLIEELQAKVG